jgi:hypothetical protein
MPKRTHIDPLGEDDEDEDEDEDEDDGVGSLLAFRATQTTSAMAPRTTPRTRAVEDAVIRSLDERPVRIFALDDKHADQEEGTETERAASRSVEEEEGETKIYFEGRPPPVYESNDDVVAKMRAKHPRTGAEIRGEALRLDAARTLKSTDVFDLSRVVGGAERERKVYEERQRRGRS